ncbi:flagellar biosynthesis anti-sigma factor FlgM [Hippea alviniae]|uniref:flagellar biosynthesis anti-sigma factor FlgM n=1 Tax=Hippea alviniae TaxID=1279027 RepID=UPI0003B3FF61|nr:flagellar biosynthesis anti-sigma factor FlgM [Hippea alviniae]
MKIDAYLSGVLDKYIKQSKTEQAKKVDIKTEERNEQQAQTGELDKVEISPQAKLLAELQDDSSSKAEKIARIKAQIENGTYKPNIDEIAKSILKEWKGE